MKSEGIDGRAILKELEARWASTGDPEALAKSRRAFQRTIRTKIKERDPHS